MLTEEEKELVDTCRKWGEDFLFPTLIIVIDRLVTENEELKKEAIPRTRSEIEMCLETDIYLLKAQLDAIKKAWNLANCNANGYDPISFERKDINALGKLIEGGGK